MLIDFLEKALTTGCDSIEIEYKDGKEWVSGFWDRVGYGIGHLDPHSRHRSKGLHRRPCGSAARKAAIRPAGAPARWEIRCLRGARRCPPCVLPHRTDSNAALCMRDDAMQASRRFYGSGSMCFTNGRTTY